MEKDINTVDEKIEEEVEQKEAETVEASQSAEATTDVEDTPVEEKEVVSEEKTEEVKDDAPVEEKEKFDSSIQVSNETNEIVEDDTKKKNKEPRSTKEKVFLGLKIAGNILFYLVIILLFLISIMNINANNNDGMPSIFGRGYLSVQSKIMMVCQVFLVEDIYQFNLTLCLTLVDYLIHIFKQVIQKQEKALTIIDLKRLLI